MAFDGFFCIAVANEINSWTGARVDKLNFSSPTSLCLSLYLFGKRANLLISASASRPMIALTEDEPFHPEQPTGLCMLFRKHLLNARLASVECVKNERIIRFSFDSADDMGYISKRYIYAEMMGKYSNIILCNEDNRILGASSVADITASVRQVMAGMPYELPPKQNKIDLGEAVASREAFFKLLEQNSEKRADNFLVSAFFSFSPLIAREVVFKVCGRTDADVYELDKERFFSEVKNLNELVENKQFVPTLIKSAAGEGIEFSFMPIAQYGNSAVCEAKSSFSELLNLFFGKKEESAGIKQYASDILKIVNGALSRLQKKIELQKAELKECARREQIKKEGDLITANLYRLKQGDERVKLYDYEEEKEVEVILDPKITPAKNAQNRYKKYAKLKRAEAVLKAQIQKALNEIYYLESVLDFVTRAQSVQELSEIRKELIETGYIASQSAAKKQRNAPQKPLTYTTSGGYLVRAGRNNRENDSITASADKWDIWFHIKGFHGSHVILYTNGTEPSAQDYTEAAQIAAYHSEKRGSENVAVDYTQVRYLKKPNGSPPGFITYEKYWTAYVNAKLPELPPSK
ncbi:MAG TPA: NFACT RNA binding domain-containing protein [Bacillota bacterium]|nr:NFACT RNA binding domain-containing protein [Bacillota bacterium]HOK69741.1 NFACT RNA binding domain-containing protein [Bacillota bacterium]HPP85017.1 NFACT RNA binding domain-containing protein [Bacillota bacterium]